MSKKFYHQGDVFFMKQSDAVVPLEGKAIAPEKGQIVLQHGEALGHYHTVQDQPEVKVVEGESNGSIKELLLSTTKSLQVTHEEHSPITLSPGTWTIRTQRELRDGVVRPVVD